MEELLCDAAMRGNLESLHEIIAKDNYILDKGLVGSFKGKNPLHVATSTGQLEFVLKLLEIKPKLAKVLDTERLGAALHIASTNGDVKIVEALVELGPEMCMARNRDGNNPLHIAAMEGKVDVLKKLVETCPHAAQVILDRGASILHLCVNYNQLESLELLLEIIGDPKFVHSKDANGNTILHLAVFGKRVEIVKHILDRTTIKVNELNGAGWTAMDINYFFARNHPPPEEVDRGIRTLLRAVGAQMESQKLLVVSEIIPSGQNVVHTFMVVSSLFATMAFQVGVNPPGGIWQDDSEEHVAGKAILAYKYPKSYSCFMFFNTVGFLLSLYFIIQVLLATASPLAVRNRGGFFSSIVPLLTIIISAFTYTYSIIAVSPKHLMAITNTILVSVIVWAFFLLLSVAVLAAAFWMAREMVCRLARDGPRLPSAVGENVSSTV